jgi:predicted phosphodiesterase
LPKRKVDDTNRIPLSEDRTKITDPMPKEWCIEQLRSLAEAHPDQVISRNFFRVHSPMAESVWNRHFGTFQEYKRQAGIILSRHAHRLEKAIAKHASVDRMRALNGEKREWEGTYERPSSRRFQTILVASDVHDLHCDDFYLRLLVDTAARVQPEAIVLNGDIFDMTEFGKYAQDPREFQPVERIKWVHYFLDSLRKAAPEASITLVEGNHEFRLLRHLSEATPAMMTVLSDLHGLTVSDLLGLKAYEVNFVARADLSAFNERDIKSELRKNYVILHNALLFHHFPEGFDMGFPGANGHHHKHTVKHAYSPTFGPYEWHQLGCGHKREAVYCSGEKWSNGFLLAHVDTQTKRSQFEYIDTSHEHCYIGGKLYTRNPQERVSDL